MTTELIIDAQKKVFSLNLGEIKRYKDLLFIFVKRDFIAVYKQTIMGPLWFLIQPILSALIFYVIFSKIARIPTDGMPPFLFYLAGLTLWNYFSMCLRTTSSTFLTNAAIFGKVYFPRIISPLSVVISNLFKFLIQFIVFLAFYAYYYFFTDYPIHLTPYVLLFPILILLMAGIGLGFGLIISSLTVKYRDLVYLLEFGIQLFMYVTPVIYPLSELKGDMRFFMMLNPLTGVMETFRLAFLGVGYIDLYALLYSVGVMVVLLFLGMIIFNRTEQNFMDVV